MVWGEGERKERVEEKDQDGFCAQFDSLRLLKFNIQKTKSMVSGPITSWQIDGKQWKQWETSFWGAPKSLQMVTAAMKLKDAYSLEEKLWPT